MKSSSDHGVQASREALWSIASDAVLVLAADGMVVDANPVAQALFADMDALHGRHLDQLVDRGQEDQKAGSGSSAQLLAEFQRNRAAALPRWTLRQASAQCAARRHHVVELAPAADGALVLLRARETVGLTPSGPGSTAGENLLAPAFEQMVRGTTEAVVVIDAKQSIVHFNPGAEQLFGWSSDAVIGRALDVLLPEAARKDHAGYVQAFMAERTSVRWMNDRTDVTARRSDGTTFQAEATILTSESPDGIVCAAVLRDITERRQQDARLRASVQDLKQARFAAEMANRAKSEFLATISHELRTPINAVIGFAHIMRSELHGPLGSHHYVGYAQDIEESAQRLLTLVNDVLDVSRIEAGRVVLACERTALDALFASCERLIAPRAADRRVGLYVEPGLLSSTVLYVDARFMKQVLVNLLSNAVKFTEAGGRVHLSAAQTPDGGVRLRVSDTGIGIPPDQLKRIFEPFVQADGSLARRFEGSGLGLMLVKSLTELHGGTVSLDSQPGVGTTAEITLPASAVIDPEAAD